MKRTSLAVSIVAFFAMLSTAVAQVRPFTPRYNNVSVRGNIKYVSNSIITTNGATTTEVAPAGTATNNNSFGVNLDVDNAAPMAVIPWASTWRFSDSGYAPVASALPFYHPGYPDGGWSSATPSATTDIGYGDGPSDEVTPYVYSGCGVRPAIQNPSCGTKYWTTYFRRQFNITDVSLFASFRMNLHRDDGAVIYVNGVEAARTNMPAGAIVYSTPALSAMEGVNEDTVINLPASIFSSGANTIAVELHQSGQASSDISFRMELLGILQDSTFNSSSADLNLASCSEVLWAGLYWGASLGNSANTSWRVGYDTILFKVPGASNYTRVISAQTDIHNNGVGSNHNGYTSYANVTSLINTLNANGTYTIANQVVPVSTGLNNQAAGWTLVIAFRNNTEIPRNLVVFDGFGIVQPGSQSDIPIGGFLTPLTGPVSVELGAVCYDGDRVSSDGFFFKQDSAVAGTYIDLTPNASSNLSDMWNSTITYFGANVTTRNPANANTLGYDADILQLPNASNGVIGNNRTSARIRISSPSSGGENFFLQVVTSAISVSNPAFSMVKRSTDLSGGVWQPGDSLRYTIVARNNGVDSSIQTIIIDTLPANVNYKPGSLFINGALKTDAAGDDEAEYDPIGHRVIFRMGVGADAVNGGYVIPAKSDSVWFTVNATQICQVLACNAVAANQARIDYIGKNSMQPMFDHSGYLSGGCFIEGPIFNSITGSCISRNDSSIVNQCPLLSVTLPHGLYAGYQFYNALPFTPGNAHNPATPITSAGTYYAFWSSGSGCTDTIRFHVIIQPCPDIDDDDDGIPDYVESNGADDFGDDDSDGVPNFTDNNYPGFIDSNNDGVNDHFDTDLDGVPNQFDRDSDNDGIPDVVESGGVDQNGDGIIDNFTDTDNDGLSQNVDANNSGQPGSGNGLGAPDFDGDGIPNYLDLDSDNDGIPDLREVGGTDADNNGMMDAFADVNGDGFADGALLLLTGADTNNDGRADSYPFANVDKDARPNPYDLDSDGDGITDVREAGLPDSDNNGRADGGLGTNGWSTVVDGLSSLVLVNTDGSGRPDFLDIDADDDGIPDNVEGLATFSYHFPAYADTDGDGIDDAYDALNGFGGNGITPNDQDADGRPDYTDLDTDNDGAADIVEGNDFNHNGMQDDLVSLTGVDTDGDGLDDRFDNDNGSPRGTSGMMGAGGSFTGDANPGSTTPVQQTNFAASDRDWRFQYVLKVDFIDLKANVSGDDVRLSWTVSSDVPVDHFDIEQSEDGVSFRKIASISAGGRKLDASKFECSDFSGGHAKIYYRINSISGSAASTRSRVIVVKNQSQQVFQLTPNPARDMFVASLNVNRTTTAELKMMNVKSQMVHAQQLKLSAGHNNIIVRVPSRLSGGLYHVTIDIGGLLHTQTVFLQR